MKEILVYFRQYFQEVNKRIFILTSVVLAILVSANYTVGIESAIKSSPSAATRFCAFFFLYALIFTSCYAIQFLFSAQSFVDKRQFIILLLLCPALFAAKISVNVPYFQPASSLELWDRYWQTILNWPIKSVVILAILYATWHWHKYPKPIAGMNRNFNWKPYVILLLCAIPIVAVAGTMGDFESTYPKVKSIAFIYPYSSNDFLHQLAYEFSYGTDFLTIEAFFRGFVVLAFVRYVGKDAILPMAAFYCTIHFGKPLFECITSYIGGIMLGVIVYNTKSIWGGLIVHLGMAWLMELVFLR
jgi:hypothetical protein